MTARPDWSMRAPDASTPQQQGGAWLSCEELQQLRRQAIGFIRWADKVLGLPPTIPDKEARRRERRASR